MKDLNATNNTWNASPVNSDVWSAKNSLFTDYSELSAQFAELKLAQQLVISTITAPLSVVQNQNKKSESSGFSGTEKLSSSCLPLNISAANSNGFSNDSVLTTPAGFYDRSPPLSIPPLFERVDTCAFLNFEKKPCLSSVSSSILSGSTEDMGSTCSTRCSSPAITASPESGSMNVTKDESRFCDQLVCSVLSQVISDDFCNDACLLSEIESIEDDSDRSNACSPSAESSTLNPLAPAFRIKPKSGRSTTKTAVTTSFRPSVVSSPTQFSYLQQQMHSPVSWTYVPTYFAASYPKNNTRKARSPVMHYTPLQDGTGIWTQYSDQVPAYSCPTVVYPTRTSTSRQWNSHRQQVCILPHPYVGLVELGYHVGLPAGSKYLPTRRPHSTHSHKSGRGPA